MNSEIANPTAVNGNNRRVERHEMNGLDHLDHNRKIERTIAYMKQHLDRPVPVAELASLANVSPSHFFALFKKWTGWAPIDFFIRLRTRYACRLFDETSLNVKEVAAALGYEDPFYFSRVFKSLTHVPPSRYRALSPQLKDRVKNTTMPNHSHDAECERIKFQPTSRNYLRQRP